VLLAMLQWQEHTLLQQQGAPSVGVCAGYLMKAVPGIWLLCELACWSAGCIRQLKFAGTKAPPPPPPPPEAGAFFEATDTKAPPARASSQSELMAALNRGSDVTAGLKHVTSDMKTKAQKERAGTASVICNALLWLWPCVRVALKLNAVPGKRRSLTFPWLVGCPSVRLRLTRQRSAGAVPATTIKPQSKPPAAAPASMAPTKPAKAPVKMLQQKRWMIENHAGSGLVELTAEEVSIGHTVYVAACRDCVIQVRFTASRTCSHGKYHG
jgi:Adenylate cyclase associated (CAP) C terminal